MFEWHFFLKKISKFIHIEKCIIYFGLIVSSNVFVGAVCETCIFADDDDAKEGGRGGAGGGGCARKRFILSNEMIVRIEMLSICI